MGRDLTIADRLRSADLEVEEIAGWKSRGSTAFDPEGVVLHHTAGAPIGAAPSLNVCVHGRTGLPGPLCNVLVGRDLVAYVVAAGRANHAGKGSWKGLVGNGSVYGVEFENVGTSAEPWTFAQTELMAKVSAALARGRFDADTCCLHKEWTPGRKVDPHSLFGADYRARVAELLALPKLPTPPDHPSEVVLFCLVTYPGATGVWRFTGAGMIGVPNPDMLGGDKIVLGSLGLPNEVLTVTREWFDSWPVIRP